MPLFRCDICGCIENTALGHYWPRDFKEYKGTIFEKALCSECNPRQGKWHNRFPKEIATEKDKGTLDNY